MPMNQELLNIIETEYAETDQFLVIRELELLSATDVMAESESNLQSTWLAILKLSKGKASSVSQYVECAKKDFRDVIFWASQE